MTFVMEIIKGSELVKWTMFPISKCVFVFYYLLFLSVVGIIPYYIDTLLVTCLIKDVTTCLNLFLMI